MKIQFLGGTGTVTGSKFLLENRDRQKVLVDCGLFQGLKDLRLRNWRSFPVDPHSISAVILTHAHIDHSGYLPKLVRDGFNGPIYCTPGTLDLCRILLPDAAYLMEEEANYANKLRYSKHTPALALFSRADADNALKLFRPVEFLFEKEIGGFRFSFRRVGHILGAAQLLIKGDGTSIAFSGDVGRPQDPILLPPDPLPSADYLVIESTYGNRHHPETDPLLELEGLIKKAVARKGSILVPAFAVGRAQHLLYAISRLRREGRIPGIPAYLDSPMAINVTELYRKYRHEHRLSLEDCERMCAAADYIHTPAESKELDSPGEPALIISASGMATGGRVLHHLKAMAPRKENLILFAGYQAAGTRGADMLAGASEVKIHGHYVPVRAEVVCLENFSAHADYRELLSWVGESGMRPRKCFVVHGELGAADAFRLRLRDQLGVECIVPEPNSCHEL